MSTDTDADRAFVAAIQGYYRDPRPAQAARALAVALDMMAVAPPEAFARFGTLIYLFGRIARESDAAHAALVDVVAGYRGPDAPISPALVLMTTFVVPSAGASLVGASVPSLAGSVPSAG